MGAGASSKGKSPGSSAPKIPTPPQIGQIGADTQALGQYESQFINEPWNLGNWAMNIATGGTGPQVSPGGVETFGGGGAGVGAGGGTPGGGSAPFGSLPGILGGFSAGENAAWNTALTAPTGSGDIQPQLNLAKQGSAQDTSYAGHLYNRGQWLTPQQEAMINQQTKANEEQVAQQEGTMGLTGSTQAAQLAGETALAGEATKGQLQQGNMQIAQGWDAAAQNWQRVAQGFMALGMSEQNQAFNQFTSIAQLSSAEQAQMFQEGTAGYQLMQTFMGAVLQPYGISLQAFNAILQANTAQVGDQVNLQSSAISADQSGQNQVVSSLGQVLSSIISAG